MISKLVFSLEGWMTTTRSSEAFTSQVMEPPRPRPLTDVIPVVFMFRENLESIWGIFWKWLTKRKNLIHYPSSYVSKSFLSEVMPRGRIRWDGQERDDPKHQKVLTVSWHFEGSFYTVERKHYFKESSAPSPSPSSRREIYRMFSICFHGL